MIYKEIELSEKGSLNGARLTVYIQQPTDALMIQKRPLIILCPGGGYAYTSDREAEPMALAFLAKGLHAAVLRYSCAPATYPTALLELGRSILKLREHADEWQIDTDSIIIEGCSAGGHLAANYCCSWNREFLSYELLKDSSAAATNHLRPNGLILCYPVISSGKYSHGESIKNLLGERYDELKDEVSLETRVSDAVPRTFIWHTFTDESVPVENSLLFAMALKEHNINTELHIYPEGGHGLALAGRLTTGSDRNYEPSVCESWIDLAGEWVEKYF